MTPASIIVDGPFCANNKCFRNFSGGYSGPQTMRWGLEQSRNLMTVRAANQIGMANVVRRASLMGVGDYNPNLAIALGAGDTTVERMVNAFATFANQGRALTPTVIDYVQDRRGRVIWRADTRPCEGCNAPTGRRPMTRPPLRTRRSSTRSPPIRSSTCRRRVQRGTRSCCATSKGPCRQDRQDRAEQRLVVGGSQKISTGPMGSTGRGPWAGAGRRLPRRSSAS